MVRAVRRLAVLGSARWLAPRRTDPGDAIPPWRRVAAPDPGGRASSRAVHVLQGVRRLAVLGSARWLAPRTTDRGDAIPPRRRVAAPDLGGRASSRAAHVVRAVRRRMFLVVLRTLGFGRTIRQLPDGAIPPGRMARPRYQSEVQIKSCSVPENGQSSAFSTSPWRTGFW